MLLEEMMRKEKQEGRQEMAVQFLIDSLESKFSVPDSLTKKLCQRWIFPNCSHGSCSH